MPRRIIIMLVTIAIVLLVRRVVDRGVVDPDTAGRAPSRAPNLLFITIDTLRRDFVGCYGDPSVRSPVLDALARDAVVFDSAIALASTTAPSHATMMTARHPRTHGVLANGQTLAPGIPTLAGLLVANGYRTAAFVSASVLSRQSGLDRGFEHYGESYGTNRRGETSCPAETTTALAAAWLRANSGAPFFLWVHYYDPHEPYSAPGAYGAFADPSYDGVFRAWSDSLLSAWERGGRVPERERAHLEARYRAEVFYVDTQLGALLDTVDGLGLRENTLVCVTSDHGETLGEHAAFFGHGPHLYDTSLLVPLLFSYPAAIPSGRRVEGLASHLGLAPTILELLGVAEPDGFEGESLVSMWAGGGAPEPSQVVSETYPPDHRAAVDATAPLLQGKFEARISVRTETGKLIRGLQHDSTEVFALDADPAETRNLAHTDSARTRELSERLARWEGMVGGAASFAPLDAETREQLRSLGYID